MHYDLKMVAPGFESKLTSDILSLQNIANKPIKTRIHPSIFLQLKDIFHVLEGLSSVRIEGNNTVLSEIIERKFDKNISLSKEEKHREYDNTEEALKYIEDNINFESEITKEFILNLHKIVVSDLRVGSGGEGDKTPGRYRNHSVEILNSNHKPPLHIQVEENMNELLAFINIERSSQFHILVVAIAHHRFAWIHPFGNGNGRVARLLTYALLIKFGFLSRLKKIRIINPSAIFCMDRNKYYDLLARADSGEDEHILNWCSYVAEGLLVEMQKIDKLLDYDFLVPKIMKPALTFSLEHKHIDEDEYKILVLATEKMVIVNDDIKKVLHKSTAMISKKIKSLILKKMLKSGAEGKRKYTIWFMNNYLLRGVIEMLKKEGFVGSLDN